MAKAENVFAAVLAVADQKGGRSPRLLVIPDRPQAGGRLETPGKGNEDFLAQALPDGTIVVNTALLRLCRGKAGTPASHGQARLAFVLGHEMAHLAYDDAWHAEAFAALNRYGDRELTEATSDWIREAPQERQAKELRADRAGFLFMLMAGYPPQGVMGSGVDFLTEFAARTRGGDVAVDPQYPAFAERARFLSSQLSAVKKDLPFYRFGVRLLMLGRHEDAISMLEPFYQRLPSREAGASLGLAYYHRAIARQRECGGSRFFRFRLPTLVDPESLASRLRLRGDRGVPCDAARKALEAAERVLREAHKHDPHHLAARLNLAVVLLALEKPVEAYSVAAGKDVPASARGTAPLDSNLANVEAVALYQFREDDHFPTDTTDGALELLQALDGHLGPGDTGLRATVAFNRARMNLERDRLANARAGWEAFLALEPQGAWADEARLALAGLGDGVGAPPPPSPPPSGRSRARLAERLSGPLKERLARAQSQDFTLPTIKGAFLEGEGVSALRIGGVLEIVEEALRPPIDAAALRIESPRATVSGTGGRRTLVLQDAAYDVEGGRAVTRILFQGR